MWNNNPNNNRGGYSNRGQIGFGNSLPNTGYVETSIEARSSLAAKVMTFTFFSILAAMAGTFVGAQMNLSFGGGTWLLFFIAEIALIFAAQAFRDKMPINFILLYSFAAVTGLSISPLINILFKAGYSDIVYQALGITAGITVALSLYAWTTKRDFSGFAPYLFAAVIGLILIGLLNTFLFHSTLLHMVYLYAGVVIFSFYMIFDVQRIKKYQDTVGNAVMLALNLYLNIFNLFLFILQILMSFRD